MRRNSRLQVIFASVATAVLIAAGTAAAQGVSPCVIYPTLCTPPAGPRPVGPLGLPGYPGASPVYPPNVLVPAMPMVVQDALKALPPAVRQSLYPPHVAEAIRNGTVDAAINKALRNGALPYLGIINGTGPGGAAYTNRAAQDLLQGNSPLWELGKALSPTARALDRRAACRAAGTCR
jgi:hypothetical protein